MPSSNLNDAKQAKNDEFYTQYDDIQKEVNAYIEFDADVFRGKTVLLPCDDPEWSNFTKFFVQNFKRFGLKKLISTSFAADSKLYKTAYQPTLFETASKKFDKKKTAKHGKIFTLTHDASGDGRVDLDDMGWDYLAGDGDFRSEEVKKLRDEADVVITNPPFSLFREFLAWIMESDKQFLIIGNINAVSYKEVFPLIKGNETWLGPSITSGDREFVIPKGVVDKNKFTGEIRKNESGKDVYYQKVVGIRWFTNLDHGRRHEHMQLMTMADNSKYSTRKEIKGQEYKKYDNYKAIDVPFVEAIPADYKGVMGVPISFLDKYSPEQFNILGSDYDIKEGMLPNLINPKWKGKIDRGYINGKRIYARIFIKKKGKK